MTKIRPKGNTPKKVARQYLPPEGTETTSELWAVGSFLIAHNTEIEISTIVDVLRRAMIQFPGTLEQALDLAYVLGSARSGGNLIFPMDDVPTDPEVFFEMASMALVDYHETMEENLVDDVDVGTAFNVGRSSLLDELIKPSKKD